MTTLHSRKESLPMPTPARSSLRLLIILAVCSLAASFAATDRAQAAPKRIQFARGASSAVVSGTIEKDSDGMLLQDYELTAAAGQTLRLRLDSAEPTAAVRVFCPGDGQSDAIADRGGELLLPAPGDYRIRITTRDFAAIPQTLAYTLTAAVEGKPKPAAGAGTDLTGTYFRDDLNHSQIEVKQVAPSRIEFHVLAFHGREAPNIGEIRGAAPLDGRRATFTGAGNTGDSRSECKLSFAFDRDAVEVTEEGDCDFGAGVDASGAYRRESLCAAPRAGAEPGDFQP